MFYNFDVSDDACITFNVFVGMINYRIRGLLNYHLANVLELEILDL